jgi:hypothetical protein
MAVTPAVPLAAERVPAAAEVEAEIPPEVAPETPSFEHAVEDTAGVPAAPFSVDAEEASGDEQVDWVDLDAGRAGRES